MHSNLTRDDYVLAVLSTANGAAWTPVQVQKIFFLLDQKVSAAIGGPRFAFAPYDYGPFDSNVYVAIEQQQGVGYALVDQRSGGMKSFRLTQAGQVRGQRVLLGLPEGIRNYIMALAHWLRALSFAQLVSAVYREFPAMREKSVFRDPA